MTKSTSDNLELVVPLSQRARANFEDIFGVPTNIDAVWNEREASQTFKNKERLASYKESFQR